MNKQAEKLAAGLIRRQPDVPPEKAQAKASATVAGAFVFGLGVLLAFAGVALIVLPVITLKSEPSLYLIVFGLAVVLAGVYFAGKGGHGMSGETLEDADGFFGFLGGIFKAWRGAPKQ